MNENKFFVYMVVGFLVMLFLLPTNFKFLFLGVTEGDVEALAIAIGGASAAPISGVVFGVIVGLFHRLFGAYKAGNYKKPGVICMWVLIGSNLFVTYADIILPPQ